MVNVSIITATFNVMTHPGAASLRRCVDSVSRISLPHEHIIQDGNSKDGTMEALQDIAADITSLRVESASDAGIYDALNRGVYRSDGQWIYVLGCDDEIVDPVGFAKAVETGERHGSDIVVSPVYTTPDLEKTSGRLDASFFCGMPFPHQGLLMRKNLIERLGGFNLEYHIAADYELIVRALLAGVKVAEWPSAYALYGVDGVSSRSGETTSEYIKAKMQLFDIDHDEASDLEKRRILPWRVVFRYWLRPEPYLRRVLKFHFKRNIANNLGLIDSAGVFRWKLNLV